MQGNVALLLSLDEEVEHYSYSAFGEEKENNTLSPWRFCSKRVDPHTGLVQFGRRFYLPKYGRWLTPDPLGFTSNQNLYAFAHNNALVRLDEYGLFDFEKFKEDTKYAGQYFLSNAIHDTWKAAGTTVALAGELGMATGRMFSPFTDSPSYDWNNFLEGGHHSIDKVFGTNLTGQKLMEQKLPLTMGEMPMGSMFGTAAKIRQFVGNVSRPFLNSLTNGCSKLFKMNKGAFVLSKKLSDVGAKFFKTESTLSRSKQLTHQHHFNKTTKHASVRMRERGISEKMIKITMRKGKKYYDPKNRTYNYILNQNFVSGKSILVGQNPKTGKITTVIKGYKLNKPRFELLE